MPNALRKELEKAIEASKNEEIIFTPAPKAAVRAAVKEILKVHAKTIKELANR
ncbi:hypothetical protein [Vibrio anguillarum]|uniref:hypothetical protein n=1 Tax=Vibrio anguillarum TaxID=55601 RepID=UPI0018FF0EB9|nr:hypothetical protein [Vibrio anguillarum]